MFQGYSQETVDFMWGIRFNNERGWFLAHKDDYQQHLLAPTRELGQAVYEGLSAALPQEPLILKAPRPGTLQGPPVVLRPHRRPGLDRPPHLLF